MQYIVLELQTGRDGKVAHIVNKKDTYGEALQAYYNILMYACVTSLPTHGVMILTGEGEVLKAEFYHGPEEQPEEPTE